MFDESKHPRDKGKFSAGAHATSPDRWTPKGSQRWAQAYLSGGWQKHTRKNGQDFIDGQKVSQSDIDSAKGHKAVKYRDRDDMDPSVQMSSQSDGALVGHIKLRK